MALAADLLYRHFEEDDERLYRLKKHFIQGLREIDHVNLNGFTEDDPCGENMAPHIVSAAFRGVRSEVLLHALEADGIYVSAGSACSARKPQPSATLKAMGAEKAVLESTIRFSMSVFTTEEEIDYTLKCLRERVPFLRKYTRH